MFSTCCDTFLEAKKFSQNSSFSAFNVPMKKSTLGKFHPPSEPLHYGNIRKADYEHSGNNVGFYTFRYPIGVMGVFMGFLPQNTVAVTTASIFVLCNEQTTAAVTTTLHASKSQ
jgi:hypothetical protein